jgi:hypothetical protein
MSTGGLPLTPEGLWHYLKGGEAVGPILGAELRRLAATGCLSPDDRVRPHSDSGTWVLACQISGLFDPATQVPATGKPDRHRRALDLFLAMSPDLSPDSRSFRARLDKASREARDGTLSNAPPEPTAGSEFPPPPDSVLRLCDCCHRRRGRHSRFYYGKRLGSGKHQVVLRPDTSYGAQRYGTLSYSNFEVTGCHDSSVCWLCVCKHKLIYAVIAAVWAVLMLVCSSGLEYIGRQWRDMPEYGARFPGMFLYAAVGFAFVGCSWFAISYPFARRSTAADDLSVSEFSAAYRSAGHDAFLTRRELAELEYRGPHRYARVHKDYPRSRDPQPSPRTWAQWLYPRLVFVGCIVLIAIIIIVVRRYARL